MVYGGSFIDSINWNKMGEVALGWVISPLLGFFGAYGFQLLVSKIMASQQKGLRKLEKMEKFFIYFLIVSVC